MIRVVPEFEISQPYVTGLVRRCGGVILLVRTVSKTRPFRHALDESFPVQSLPRRPIANIARPKREVALRRAHAYFGIPGFAIEQNQNAIGHHRRNALGSAAKSPDRMGGNLPRVAGQHRVTGVEAPGFDYGDPGALYGDFAVPRCWSLVSDA